MAVRRAAVIVSALALVLALACCGVPAERAGEEVPAAPLAGGKVYFDHDVWRADADYSGMEYERYELEDLDALLAPIYALAQSGGSAGEFEAADQALCEELYWIHTMSVIADNASRADVADMALAEESDSALATYYAAYDEAMAALGALARSEHRELMEGAYDGPLIDYISRYEPPGGEEDGLSARESELIREYYALIGAEDRDMDAVGELFVELVGLRNEKAAMAGYDNYADYAYDSLYIKDYSPEDAQVIWQGAREYFAPVVWSRAEAVLDGADRLEADRTLDCSVPAVLAALSELSGRLSPELEEACGYLTGHGLYDIDGSAGKSEEGYTVMLYYYNEPFIFNRCSGAFFDYTDIMHEFGHFVSSYYNPGGLLFGMPDNDLCELQAQGMTVVMSTLFEDYFGRERGGAMGDWTLFELALSVVDGAMYDEFQQRVYSEPELTPERVDEIFAQIYAAYGYSPYEGYEREWMDVSHNFSDPFYYISYAASAIGALEIYDLCRSDMEAGLDMYLRVLAMDPEEWYYSEALEEAGLSDIFALGSYESTAAALDEALAG